jgi:hypothetical protein
MNAASNLPTGITSERKISACIDWISATYPYAYRAKNQPTVLPDDWIGGFEKVHGINGYSHAKLYQSGALECYHPEQEQMGIHVIYTAQSLLSACENYNCSQYEILDYFSESAKITRLDLALDAENIEIDIRKLYEQMLTGIVVSRARTFDFTESAKAGNEIGARTAYVGSMRNRKKLLRTYDKGMQMNLDHYLIRFELETHGGIAQNAACLLLDDISRMQETIAGMIQGYADFSKSVAAPVFADVASIKIGLPRYQRSDTANWLINSVAKTLAKETDKDPFVAQAFLSKFQQEYEAIQLSKEYNI